ncbi:MAG: hypothetical protein R2814_09790 [Flavobacteriaceae bacterium]
MDENENVVGLLSHIKDLLFHCKKVMNAEDLDAYTGLSKSKIYKLAQPELMGNSDLLCQTFYIYLRRLINLGRHLI